MTAAMGYRKGIRRGVADFWTRTACPHLASLLAEVGWLVRLIDGGTRVSQPCVSPRPIDLRSENSGISICCTRGAPGGGFAMILLVSRRMLQEKLPRLNFIVASCSCNPLSIEEDASGWIAWYDYDDAIKDKLPL
jgi:hypothetical protein